MVLGGVAETPRRTASRWVSPSGLKTHMNAPLLPEVLLQTADGGQAVLPLATGGVLRYAWEGRFGSILIEVIGEEIFVNGKRVEQHTG